MSVRDQPWGLVQPEASGPTRSKYRFYKTVGVLNIFVVKNQRNLQRGEDDSCDDWADNDQ